MIDLSFSHVFHSYTCLALCFSFLSLCLCFAPFHLSSSGLSIPQSTNFILHKIGTLRQFLSQAANEKLVHALIMPRIDFCNSLLYSLSDMQISKLQRIQNSAVRLVKRTPVRQPISPILQELHWLPVK